MISKELMAMMPWNLVKKVEHDDMPETAAKKSLVKEMPADVKVVPVKLKKMGRPPKGAVAMTAAERVKACRARKKNGGG